MKLRLQSGASTRGVDPKGAAPLPWPVWCVDDDPDVHQATRFVLSNLVIEGRPLELIHARSASEALALLPERPAPALMLVDVVMEHDRAGLDLVRTIRDDLGNRTSRIILRTGQPGYAPQMDVIRSHDINDYIEKAEGTSTRLITAVTMAIRGFNQIDRLRRAEREIAERAARFEAITQMTDELVLVVDGDGVIQFRAGGEEDGLFAGRDLLGGRLIDLIVGPDRAVVEPLLTAADTRSTAQARVVGPEGSLREVRLDSRTGLDVPGLAGAVVRINDVTDRLREERQLRQRQKLEAIGRLSGGIAHDFNNILGAIRGFAALLLDDLAEGSDQHRFASRIETSCERGRDLVQQIMSFARADDGVSEWLDLRETVAQACDIAAAGLGGGVRLQTPEPGTPVRVRANPSQITQMILNLCFNARDALVDREVGDGGRVIRIALEVLPRGVPALVDGPCDGPSGETGWERVVVGEIPISAPRACLTVSDAGCGMGREVLERICEPFYTTKPRTKGTGLGLSVVHGVVQAQGGGLVVESCPGAGTRFEIHLPLSGEDKPSSGFPVALATSGSGAGRDPVDGEGVGVLVVDDERDMAEAMAINLERRGFAVTVVGRAEDALALIEADPTRFDVVLTDHAMEAMTGLELLERGSEIAEATAFVLYSGYSDEIDMNRALAAGADAFFSKPADPDEVARKISELAGLD